ncbi:unnamed protein product [Cylindrotheca closterium]|uniref:Uncharacterized protein n=1 Tax=Cylindrotheca closterium TaxID=2856 RepID=A0AAD2FZI3_9STRA|nr:unnamed protein product [Cylindrotheca closterium]
MDWKNQDQYVKYRKKLNLNQTAATVPATVPAVVPGASASQVEHQVLREAGAQVRQGFDATQARTPQVLKTGYYDTSNVLNDAIKGKDENDNDVYLIPCPAGTTDVKLQANWHYASEDEDVPDLATEAD